MSSERASESWVSDEAWDRVEVSERWRKLASDGKTGAGLGGDIPPRCDAGPVRPAACLTLARDRMRPNDASRECERVLTLWESTLSAGR